MRDPDELLMNGPLTQGAPSKALALVRRAAVFVALVAFYLLTAPWYHTTAVDSYNFAHMVVDRPYMDVGNRLFLWLTAMHALYDIAAWIVPDPDPFLVAGVANAIITALAVILMQSLLRRHLGLSDEASWLTAGLFAISYGTWRYATEFEVYAFAALASIVLLHLAFRTGDKTIPRRTRAILATAAFGAVATLAYQPIGIVAGFAIPAYLLLRLALWPTVTYLAAYSMLTGAGMLIIGGLRARGEIEGVAGMLDTDGKLPLLPPLSDIGVAAVAFGQNILSMNWVFMFEPTRQVIENRFRDQFIQELVASEQSYAGQSLFLLTLPVAATILIAALILILRPSRQRAISAAEVCLLLWLSTHAAMALLLHPTGFETWLPALVPFILLAGMRIVDPLVASGGRILPNLALATMLVHNWFAGVGFLALADKDYNVARGGQVLSLAGPDDLLVVDRNWAFERYLNYAGSSRTFLISALGLTGLNEAAEATLASGRRIFLFDDVLTGHPDVIGAWPDPAHLETTAERIDLGELGHVLILRAQ
jgi:hypothetical protein